MLNSIKTALAACAVTVVLSGSVAAASYEDGLAAYRSGDYKTAWNILHELADKGDAAAQYNFAIMYSEGRGVVRNEMEALKWYQRAAELGHPIAQNIVGLRYAAGQGVAKDDAEAAKWYQRAADQGQADAQFNLGLAYANGKGVQQDYVKAADWWKRAGEFGHPGAQYNLGVIYSAGQGVMKDLKAAQNWYLLAAEKGHVGAQNNLGTFFASGSKEDRIPPDYVQAHKWFNLAASRSAASETESIDLGIRDFRGTAVKNRDLVAAKMTREQIAEAEKLARDWATIHTKMFCYYFSTVAGSTGYCNN